MNLISKQGPRFCADAAGANGTKGADAGDKFKAASDVAQDKLTRAKQIAKELESENPSVRILGVEKLIGNQAALAYVFRKTRFDNVRERVKVILSEMVEYDPERVTHIEALKIIAIHGELMGRRCAVKRLGDEVERGSISEDYTAFEIVAIHSLDDTAAEAAITRLCDMFKNGKTETEGIIGRIARNRGDWCGRIIAQQLKSVAGKVYDVDVLAAIVDHASPLIGREVREKLTILLQHCTDFERGFERVWIEGQP